MISGVHAIIYTPQADRLREFFRDVLQLPSIDAGHGWLIFALPPAEVAMHPDAQRHHELYLMCTSIRATTEELKKKGVDLASPITDRGWGLVTRLKLPSGDEIGLYEPKHPTALPPSKPARKRKAAKPTG